MKMARPGIVVCTILPILFTFFGLFRNLAQISTTCDTFLPALEEGTPRTAHGEAAGHTTTPTPTTTTAFKAAEAKKEERNNEKIPIFYNLFVAKEEDIPYVDTLLRDQLKLWNPKHHGDVKITSLGVPLPNLTEPTQLLQHHPEGSEMLSLDAIWEYCHDNPTSKVIYLHSKGSFHPRPENDRLRNILTRAALSEECANLPSTCNVCAFRMSPFPHPHTPGNMWLGRCSYITQLMRPQFFSTAMGGGNSSCVGAGRYAMEHWVHSHPDNKPCDLDSDSTYTWGYLDIPTKEKFESNMTVATTAPRFPADRYVNAIQRRACAGRFNGDVIVKEYFRVYGKRPALDWWGWNWYPWLSNSSHPKDYNQSRLLSS